MRSRAFWTVRFHIIDSLGTCYVAFNAKQRSVPQARLGADYRAGRGLTLLIDRDYIVENIGQTGQQLAMPGWRNYGGMATAEVRRNDDACLPGCRCSRIL